ncbi:MAG: FAD:protein FMN transferase [Gammaproteobacteria bacterium]|nr:MAG: FAD:protein FMN transferase [Gammaproteobacteria bacterium]
MKKLPVFLSIPILLIAAFILIDKSYSGAVWSAKELKLFGTTVSIQVNHEKRTIRELAIKKVIEEFKRIENQFSPYISTSEISVLNNTAFNNTVKVSDETARLIRFASGISQLSEGAFDITYASVGQLYDFRNQSAPSAEQLAKAKYGIGFNNLELYENNTVSFKNRYTKISFGGFAKGYAVKQAIEILKGYGISNALVTAGGDSMVIGTKNGNPWRTGIKAPRGQLRAVYTFNLTDKAISTSGDYERYFIDGEGDHVHHIVNPATGNSASDVQSVTVIGNDPTFTDALSTAMFVLGAKRSMVLAEGIDHVEALVIDKAGDFHISTGFPQHQTFSPRPEK